MKAWFLAARPKTLPAAIVPVWVGTVPALWGQNNATFSWLLFWVTLLSCLCIQIATNLFNDAVDSRKGADTEQRLGPTRVTASGLLSQNTVVYGAIGFCLLAALFAIPLIQQRGWVVLVIGAVSLFFAYGYTGGPWPLAYKGLGEVFVILFFGFVAVLGTYFVQTGNIENFQIWVLGLQCGLYSSVLIAINNLRDMDEDTTTGKRTLAVRFGKSFARWEITVFCTVPLWLWLSFPPDAGKKFLIACLLFVLVALPMLYGIWRNEPGKVYNKYLGMAAVQLLLFAGFVTAVHLYKTVLL